MFTRNGYATSVDGKLRKAMLGLDKKANDRLLVAMSILMENITTKKKAPHQRVDESTTSEGMSKGQRIGPAPAVTATTPPTHKLSFKPCHVHITVIPDTQHQESPHQSRERRPI